jgi:uncharacterized membrane protein
VRRRLWVTVSSVAFAVLLAAGVIAGVTLNPEKSFSLPRVSIAADLHPDGSMRVVEHLTYDFTGSFSFGTRPIPLGPYLISDVSVTEHGRPLVAVGAPYNLQWFFTAKDEQRTFDVAYTVTNAAVVGPDVVELYWKWVGEAHPTIGRVNVALTVPPGAGPIRAWGHGPLNGDVRVGADSVRWNVRSVPQGTFVEGRVAAPRARFPGIIQTTVVPRLPSILIQERQWAAAANRARAEAAHDARSKRDARDVLAWLAPLVAAVSALGFALIWVRWGREPPAPTDIGKYFRELPDDPPAVVDALMHWGHVRPNAFGATVLDLAQRGYLSVAQTTIERPVLPDRTEYVFTRAPHPPATVTTYDEAADEVVELPEGKLRGFEKATLDQVFAAGSPVTQTEMVKHSRENQAQSRGRWAMFEASVERSLRARGYLRAKRALPYVLNVVLVIVVAVIALAALTLQAWVGGAIALAWAAVQLALTPLLRQRTPDGQRRIHEWLGVRNYLRDFSQLADAPAGHLVLWERYLVYAVALGVSDDLAHGLAARIPPEEAERFATWYVSPYQGASYGSIGHFSDGFASSAVGAFAPPSSGSSSGSGSGGGFSGGGGGGGGGGGIGAG